MQVMKVGTRGKSLLIPINLQKPVVAKKNYFIKIQARNSFSYKFIPHVYIAPRFVSCDIRKITEINKSALYPRILGITQLKRISPIEGD